jgi:hypothetical protein
VQEIAIVNVELTSSGTPQYQQQPEGNFIFDRKVLYAADDITNFGSTQVN